MSTILKPVGGKVRNTNRHEVMLVQRLLNKHRPVPLRQIAENGVDADETTKAIQEFQHRVLHLAKPDGQVDPGGRTLLALDRPPGAAPAKAADAGVFSHPDADKVTLTYSIQGDGKQVVKLNDKAEKLLKSILASCGMTGGRLNSTLRTYHDQARITVNETYKADPKKVAKWYGEKALEACEKYLNDIPAFAIWWEAYDKKRGKVSSLHLTNRAMDVVPSSDRAKFADKVQELAAVSTSGVKRIIPKGVMGEPVDHVEFHFDVT